MRLAEVSMFAAWPEQAIDIWPYLAIAIDTDDIEYRIIMNYIIWNDEESIQFRIIGKDKGRS